MTTPSVEEREASLLFEELEVASLGNISSSDQTYYATMTMTLNGSEGTIERAVLDFVRFSKDWNRRCDEDPANPPSADEFLAYGVLIETGKWRVLGFGEPMALVDVPLFYGSNEISWRCD